MLRAVCSLTTCLFLQLWACVLFTMYWKGLISALSILNWLFCGSQGMLLFICSCRSHEPFVFLTAFFPLRLCHMTSKKTALLCLST